LTNSRNRSLPLFQSRFPRQEWTPKSIIFVNREQYLNKMRAHSQGAGSARPTMHEKYLPAKRVRIQRAGHAKSEQGASTGGGKIAALAI